MINSNEICVLFIFSFFFFFGKIFYISWCSLLRLHQHIFSGMEIASYLIGKASSITVIGSSELPYQNTLGPEIGRATMMVRKRKRDRERERTSPVCILAPLLSVHLLAVCCLCRCCQSKMWNSTWTTTWRRSEVWMARWSRCRFFSSKYVVKLWGKCKHSDVPASLPFRSQGEGGCA